MDDEQNGAGALTVQTGNLPVIDERGNYTAALLGQYHGASAVMPLGMESFTPADLNMVPGRLSLIHKVETSEQLANGWVPGAYRLGKYIFKDGLRIIILKGHYFRVLMEGPEKKKQPTCGSTGSGQLPDESVPSPKSESCKGCRYAEWTDRPGGGRIKPPCDDGYAFIGLVRSSDPKMDHRPFWFLAKGTAKPAGLSMLQGFGGLEVPTMACREVFMSSQPKSSGGGVTYYLPIFTIDPTEIPHERYLAVCKAVASSWYRPTYSGARDDSYVQPATDVDPWAE